MSQRLQINLSDRCLNLLCCMYFLFLILWQVHVVALNSAFQSNLVNSSMNNEDPHIITQNLTNHDSNTENVDSVPTPVRQAQRSLNGVFPKPQDHVTNYVYKEISGAIQPPSMDKEQTTVIENFIDKVPYVHYKMREEHGTNFTLGGVFPVHVADKGGSFCRNEIHFQRGIQRIEAMRFALNQINNERLELLPNVKFGYLIKDSCGSPQLAQREALDFLQEAMNRMSETRYTCSSGEAPVVSNPALPIPAVIGASDTSVSAQVAGLLQLFRISQISPASTGSVLSDKQLYPYFVRTVPPDVFQASAMVDVISVFNWTYVHAVSSSDSYGQSGIDQFKRKVVVLFATINECRELLAAATRRGARNRFIWLASDAWGRQYSVVDTASHQQAALGAITIELQSGKGYASKAFDKYMKSRRPYVDDANPWFAEYWAQKFGCRQPWQSLDLPLCDGSQTLDTTDYEMDPKVPFVIDAVYTAVHALDSVYRARCLQDVHNECVIWSGSQGDRDLLHRFIRNIKFFDGMREVKFTEDGDGLPKYSIYNFRMNRDNMPQYVHVADWDGSDLKSPLKFIDSQGVRAFDFYNKGHDASNLINSPGMLLGPMGMPYSRHQIPVSVCSDACGPGERKRLQSIQCCWFCDRCEVDAYLKDEFTCVPCPRDMWPNNNFSGCNKLPVQVIEWDTAWALIPVALAIKGILMTWLVAAVLIKYNDTPLVKASGRELCFLILSGCLMCYLTSLLHLAHPSSLVCGTQRVMLGTSFAMLYAPLLTKTNRIYRIFCLAHRSGPSSSAVGATGDQVKRSWHIVSTGLTAVRNVLGSSSSSGFSLRFISPESQIIISTSMVGSQLLASLAWIFFHPPGTREHYPIEMRDQVVLKCSIQDDSMIISLAYTMLLIVLCTVYAVKTRNIPENFNEAKFIGFTMYTTCIVWLAFVPLYFGLQSNFRVQTSTLCVAISLSATVALLCLFGPKVFIIVFQPEKNIRHPNMMVKSRLSLASMEMNRHQVVHNGNICTATIITNQNKLRDVPCDHQLAVTSRPPGAMIPLRNCSLEPEVQSLSQSNPGTTGGAPLQDQEQNNKTSECM